MAQSGLSLGNQPKLRYVKAGRPDELAQLADLTCDQFGGLYSDSEGPAADMISWIVELLLRKAA